MLPLQSQTIGLPERVAQSFTKMAAYSDGVDEARTAIHREKERRARGVPAK